MNGFFCKSVIERLPVSLAKNCEKVMPKAEQIFTRGGMKGSSFSVPGKNVRLS